MLEIPIASNGPHFTQENQIFGCTYNLEFEWIEREGFWAMHIFDASEQPLALGIWIISRWPLFMQREGDSLVTFLLIPKTPNAQLKLETLQSDFTLVAYAAL
jgi:hypothetical protein